MNKKEKDLARALWENRNDTEEWVGEADEIKSRPSGSQVVSVRLPSEEFDALVVAVERSGEKLSEFVRKALALRLHGRPIGPTVSED